MKYGVEKIEGRHSLLVHVSFSYMWDAPSYRASPFHICETCLISACVSVLLATHGLEVWSHLAYYNSWSPAFKPTVVQMLQRFQAAHPPLHASWSCPLHVGSWQDHEARCGEDKRETLLIRAHFPFPKIRDMHFWSVSSFCIWETRLVSTCVSLLLALHGLEVASPFIFPRLARYISLFPPHLLEVMLLSF
jgi:hypothetical protein